MLEEESAPIEELAAFCENFRQKETGERCDTVRIRSDLGIERATAYSRDIFCDILRDLRCSLFDVQPCQHTGAPGEPFDPPHSSVKEQLI